MHLQLHVAEIAWGRRLGSSLLGAKFLGRVKELLFCDEVMNRTMKLY